AEQFFSDPSRPRLGESLTFDNWYLGKHLESLDQYEKSTDDFFKKAFENLFLYYKGDAYGIQEFIESVLEASNSTDLVIVDHVHYFDLEDDNENRAMKEITKTARRLALE